MNGRETVGEREGLEHLRQENMGRLCLRLFRAFNARVVANFREQGHTGITVAHTALLINLDSEGTRIVDLAARAGISKQAMGRLVADLQQAGYIQSSPHPIDRRATIVMFTERGRQFLRDAVTIQREVEAGYAAVIGDKQYAAVREQLHMLVLHAEADTDVS